MKKRVLLVTMLQFFLMLNSCSGPESQPGGTPEVKGEIKADYITSFFINDFVVSADNILYTIGQTNDEKGYYVSLKKTDLDGKETTLKNLDLGIYTYARLALANNGDLLMVAKGNDEPHQDKIMRFENNFSELNPFYTMKPISSPFASKINLFRICSNNDNTYFVFDLNARNIKRVLPELKGDVFVAGSGKNEIKDGTGLEASFAAVTKIISFNSILYLIDEVYDPSTGTYKNSAIRKLEYVNNEWKVTTLVSATNGDHFSDLTFDTKNELYVVNAGKGIFKLNLQDNSLSLFKDGDLRVKASGSGRGVYSSFKYTEMLKFKGNDIYLLVSGNLIKISDFQTKFAATEK
ncbi:hypothetical protein JI750_16165 [Flavobacterium sp. GN10]|uniref:Lipoprotein n=1 Tax=Flavobacterium tagetis TaxID=2801336 RepID=A0ABS1KGT0_9FLAO|nr:hypothetical protein [Flavobacterium tagetis]MBL0738432.1 hypothetical protein [Flavobacterium tagetis]